MEVRWSVQYLESVILWQFSEVLELSVQIL